MEADFLVILEGIIFFGDSYNWRIEVLDKVIDLQGSYIVHLRAQKLPNLVRRLNDSWDDCGAGRSRRSVCETIEAGRSWIWNQIGDKF